MAMHQDGSLSFRIVSVKQETALAKTYQLELPDQRQLPYKPGQFITVLIDTGKQELRRSYSILSLPHEPLRITVKRVTNGAISRLILQQWKEGDIIRALPPAGMFSLAAQRERPRDIFCFAAGSGIIPILPQVKYLLKEEPQSTVHLIYSNHNESDTLFMEEIDELARHYPPLRLRYFFSQPLSRLEYRGHLSNMATEALVNASLQYNKADAVFLVCGPFTYMRMVTITLGFMHFSKDQIRKENYIPEIMRSGHVRHPKFPERSLKVKALDKLHTIRVRTGQDILSAALEHGIPLPYSCRGGVCGNCAARCASGKVRMSINEVLSPADLKKGLVLTCTGYPEEDDTLIEFS